MTVSRGSARVVTDLKIRKIPFDFADDDVPFVWNPDNPEFAIMCNAVGILAIAFEKFVVATMAKALPMITDPEMRAEADAFTRQEGQHSRMHRQHIAALVRRYPGVQDTLDEAVAAFDELTATKPIEFNLAYTADLEATFTPIFKLFLDHHETLYAPGDDRVASLFLWHFVEEVEHRSHALMIYRHLVGSELYRFRKFPEIWRHVVSVLSKALYSFMEVIPPEDAVIDMRRVLPSRMYRREIAGRLPALRRFIHADGTGTALQDASSLELIRMFVGLIGSQTPGHDPTHQPLPAFADEWLTAYDEGRDVSTWYASSAVAQKVEVG
jgi:predicted metal-dependent hydrolase